MIHEWRRYRFPCLQEQKVDEEEISYDWTVETNVGFWPQIEEWNLSLLFHRFHLKRILRSAFVKPCDLLICNGVGLLRRSVLCIEFHSKFDLLSIFDTKSEDYQVIAKLFSRTAAWGCLSCGTTQYLNTLKTLKWLCGRESTERNSATYIGKKREYEPMLVWWNHDKYVQIAYRFAAVIEILFC